MKSLRNYRLIAVAALGLALISASLRVTPVRAQESNTSLPAGVSSDQPGVPRLINFGGIIKDASGKVVSGNVTLTLSLYEDQEGGSPLWTETQTVQADSQGHYNVLLGATQPEGLPQDLFTSTRARWLGVAPSIMASALSSIFSGSIYLTDHAVHARGVSPWVNSLDIMATAKKKPKETVTFSWPQLILALAIPVVGFAFWLGSLSSDVKDLRHDVDQLAPRLDQVWQALPGLRTSAIASHPSDPATQQVAKRLIAEASKKTIPPIPVPDVKQAGTSFVNVSASDSGAWGVALDFMNYRSSLNSDQLPDAQRDLYQPIDQNTFKTLYEYQAIGDRVPHFQSWDSVPYSDAARMERIGKPEPRSEHGSRSLLAFGGTTVLDTMYMRHVIFTGVEVHYSGGPLVLTCSSQRTCV